MSVIGNNILMGAAGQGGGYTIDRSVRLRSSASAYFSRTPASAGNRKTWTWSGWVKLGNFGSDFNLISARTGITAPFGLLRIHSATNGYKLNYLARNSSNSTIANVSTNALFRDPSAWYHVVVALDTTQATDADRLKIYVNGVIQSVTTDTAVSLNSEGGINGVYEHNIAKQAASAIYGDGYLTEVNVIDGQALDPTSFGEFNEDTGVWQPVKYTGTYGTNGFYLNFSDNTTTTTLGEDGSGNGNDWTANNISLTSGATYDSMTDTPTPYADGGNYAVLNPIDSSSLSGMTISAANLTYTTSSANAKAAASIVPSSGKWYCELTVSTASAISFGVSTLPLPVGSTLGFYTGSIGWYQGLGNVIQRDNTTLFSGFTLNNGDVLALAVDVDNKTVAFYKNGVIQHTPSTISYTYTADVAIVVGTGLAGAGGSINFGQRPFAYTPPSGFKSLNTFNLPDSDIVNGREYFNTVTYTGNGGTQSITGVGFQPDLVWGKLRSTSSYHRLQDVVRGADNTLATNATDAEVAGNGLVSFDADGFTMDSGTNINQAYPYVAWNWKANGAGVSNTDGSITSTVSANPTSGFSIVTYTGNEVKGATVGHGLGVAPAMIISKGRSLGGYDWPVYHKSLTSGYSIILNTTAAQQNTYPYFNSATPSSTTFALPGNSDANRFTQNKNGETYVAYCFAEVPGFSKFGAYTGNGSSDGPFVFTGFRPAFVMVKASSRTGRWIIMDTERDPHNVSYRVLSPSNSNAEDASTSYWLADFLSNGVKLRYGADTEFNQSAQTYIYMAFAENPFKNSLAR